MGGYSKVQYRDPVDGNGFQSCRIQSMRLLYQKQGYLFWRWINLPGYLKSDDLVF